MERGENMNKTQFNSKFDIWFGKDSNSNNSVTIWDKDNNSILKIIPDQQDETVKTNGLIINLSLYLKEML